MDRTYGQKEDAAMPQFSISLNQTVKHLDLLGFAARYVLVVDQNFKKARLDVLDHAKYGSTQYLVGWHND